MAVKIDNVTKDKKDLKVFMKHLKNRIVTPEQFKNLFMIKSKRHAQPIGEIILFETNLDNLCSISKENEKRRKDQIHEFTKDILSIDLSLDGWKMFLYTNENYSHINNKIDIDENDALQEFKLFSNYIHAKDSKFLEKYRQEDKELIEDLKDVQKLKAIDIDFDSDSYLYCYDLL